MTRSEFTRAFDLSNKLIMNGITDREIYLELCIASHFLGKKNIIEKYINDSYPLCNNVKCLSSYI